MNRSEVLNRLSNTVSINLFDWEGKLTEAKYVFMLCQECKLQVFQILMKAYIGELDKDQHICFI